VPSFGNLKGGRKKDLEKNMVLHFQERRETIRCHSAGKGTRGDTRYNKDESREAKFNTYGYRAKDMASKEK